VLNILVTQVRLQRPCVMPLVCQSITAGVSLGPDRVHLGRAARSSSQARHTEHASPKTKVALLSIPHEPVSPAAVYILITAPVSH